MASKLPNVGTTIFTVMSTLAAEVGALNLSQGFPSFPTDPALVELVTRAMQDGHNQYAPMPGVPALREAIAAKTRQLYGADYEPGADITITSGATEALFAAITAVVHPGDEVLIFEPAYDSYVPAVELAGGVPVYVTLTPPAYGIDWEQVRARLTARTRLVVVNTPHNPTGRVWTQADIAELARLADAHNLLIVADEVYEHILFDGRTHHSLAAHPALRARTFVIGSFGKTFHITGWKVGYCLAPAALTAEFRKVHQFLTFSVATPVQHALATYLARPDSYAPLSAFYQQKRDLFLATLAGSRFAPIPTQGTFFQNLSYAAITDEPDTELAIRLTRHLGVASIPVSAFYQQRDDHRILRCCFAKDDDMLREAGRRLRNWSLAPHAHADNLPPLSAAV